MKVLICGFEPFGNRNVNNAWEVGKRFVDVPNIDVIQIPVSFEKAHKAVINALDQSYYDLILILGETGFTTDYVRLERVAINYKDSAKPDNDGVIADDEEIIENAPKAYFTKFPVKRISGALKEIGQKIKVTNSAGTFVCNSVYYNLLHYLAKTKLMSTALFIHLPASTEVVSLSEMENAVKTLIESALG